MIVHRNYIKTYENIRKIVTGQGDDWTAGCLLVADDCTTSCLFL